MHTCGYGLGRHLLTRASHTLSQRQSEVNLGYIKWRQLQQWTSIDDPDPAEADDRCAVLEAEAKVLEQQMKAMATSAEKVRKIQRERGRTGEGLETRAGENQGAPTCEPTDNLKTHDSTTARSHTLRSSVRTRPSRMP